MSQIIVFLGKKWIKIIYEGLLWIFSLWNSKERLCEGVRRDGWRGGRIPVVVGLFLLINSMRVKVLANQIS